MRALKKKKVFANRWLLEPLEEEETFLTRAMFGGLAAYFDGKMVLVLMEHEGDPDWNCVMIPTSREHHAALLEQFPDLRPHRILGKWLCLDASSPELETVIPKCVDLMLRRDARFGIVPRPKKKKRSQ